MTAIKLIEAKLTHETVELLHGLIDSELKAHKNWVLSAVESGDVEYAQKLTKAARNLQELFAAFNISSRRETDRLDGYTIRI